MATETRDLAEAMAAGHTLAVADQVLIGPEPGTLVARVEELLRAVVESDAPSDQVACVLLRLGMNFVGRDAEIVGYNKAEADGALDRVLAAVEGLEEGMGAVVQEALADMTSVNLGDSLTGLLAERIEAELDRASPGSSFLALLKQHLRSGVYWRMIGERYCKFGNSFARGLEYLRHCGFCQCSTNPVLAAKAFDEDETLTEELKREIDGRDDWKRDPEAHEDEIAMAATLIAVLTNLTAFRPLALNAGLKDYMVSYQLNPNIADQAVASIDDARNVYGIVSDFFAGYDAMLGVDDGSSKFGANIVFKVAGSHPAAREITRTLNSEGIGTNNTVVYSVAQEVQLMLDAFEGKAEAALKGRPVVRTYETNMGGRFVSHLREVEAAEAAGRSPDEIRLLEEDLKKAGTLVARRVYWLFYSPDNRPKWVTYLQQAHGLGEEQARWVLESMDVLPASKRIPEDTYHALGSSNVCHTEAPNNQRAVQIMSEQEGFDLEEFRESVLDSYGPDVVERLRALPDFCRGYDLTPSLKALLMDKVGIDVSTWQTSGLEPADWPDFGPVQKTTAEFRAGYDAFATKCVAIAKEVAGG